MSGFKISFKKTRVSGKILLTVPRKKTKYILIKELIEVYRFRVGNKLLFIVERYLRRKYKGRISLDSKDYVDSGYY